MSITKSYVPIFTENNESLFDDNENDGTWTEPIVEPIVEPPLPFVPEQFYDVLNAGGAGVAGDVSEKKETIITFNVDVDFKNAPSNIDQRDFTEQLNKKLKDLPFMQNLSSLLKGGSDITNDSQKKYP